MPTSSRCGATSRRLAVPRRAAATSASPTPRSRASSASWFVEQCQRPRACELEADGNGNLLAWWIARDVPQPIRRGDAKRLGLSAVLIGSHLDSVLDGGAYDGPLGVVSSLGGDRPAQGARGRPAQADRRRCVRRGGRVSLRDRLPRAPGWPQERRPPRRPQSCATATAYPFWTRWPAPAWSPRWALRRGSTGSAPSWSCTSSRAATWSTGMRPWGWPPASGRTAATASTSPATRTTPAARGWRTGTTRCSPTRSRPSRRTSTPRLAGQRATFGRLEVAPNGTNAIPSRVTAWLDARVRVRDRAGPSGRRDQAAGIRACRSRRHARCR